MAAEAQRPEAERRPADVEAVESRRSVVVEAGEDPPPGRLSIEIVHSPCAGRVERVALSLPAGARLADALREGGFGAPPPGTTVGIWGRLLDPAAAPATPLADRDRVEFHRPLAVDPKEARRRRAEAQRAAPQARRRR